MAQNHSESLILPYIVFQTTLIYFDFWKAQYWLSGSLKLPNKVFRTSKLVLDVKEYIDFISENPMLPYVIFRIPTIDLDVWEQTLTHSYNLLCLDDLVVDWPSNSLMPLYKVFPTIAFDFDYREFLPIYSMKVLYLDHIDD